MKLKEGAFYMRRVLAGTKPIKILVRANPNQARATADAHTGS